MFDLILIRYGEMTLKKKNYRQFQNQINSNIRRKLKDFPKLEFNTTNYRFYIYLNGEDYLPVIKVLDTVVGLYSYSLCKEVKADYDEIASIGTSLLKEAIKDQNLSFKVETHRANKAFPATSIEVSQQVAKRILKNFDDLKVDVRKPDLTLSIDLRDEGTYIFLGSLPGLGGYPSGVAGRGLLMISGGIDSPVAGFLSIRKGVNVTGIHFASPPYTSDLALQKVIELMETLANYTLSGKIKLIIVPFTKIQTKINQFADSSYLVTLMRRQMYKIASSIAERDDYDVIINGESIGQVASQTLESIKVVNEVTNFPIIRPLATYDKEEIIHVSRKINSYDISIRPYEDCCTVFVPEHPVIKPKISRVLLEEEKCDLADLVIEAVNNIETMSLSCFEKTTIYDKSEDFGSFEI
jgi:thiamine biosynthesis protein ThiI